MYLVHIHAHGKIVINGHVLSLITLRQGFFVEAAARFQATKPLQ